MLSNGFDKPLHLRRKPSRLLLIYIVALHLLAGFSLLQPINLAGFAFSILWLCLIVSAGFHVWYYQRQSRDSTTYWIWQASGAWVRAADEDQLYILDTSKSVSTPWFVMVMLRNTNRQYIRNLIVSDQLDADMFRRLRARLKLHYDDAAVRNEDLA